MKNLKQTPRLLGYSYDTDTVLRYKDSGKLLCLRLDMSYECNLQCKYCYAEASKKPKELETSFEELIDTVDQAINLGVKSVVVLGGGEPLIYENIWDLLKYLSNRGIISVMFTNSTLITKKIAKKLYNLNMSVITKFDGFKNTQDFLTGEGTYDKIQMGLKNLISVGFNNASDEMLRLGCACVANKNNYSEIPEIWRYLRRNNIFPNIERMTVMGKAVRSYALTVEESKKLTKILREIDKEEFGIQWDSPYSAIPGHMCSVFYVGCHINAYREVSPCPELPPVESLREKPLKEIINGNFFNKTRHINKYIEGKCANCAYLKKYVCYGCRSKVFHDKGSLFLEDHYCYI